MGGKTLAVTCALFWVLSVPGFARGKESAVNKNWAPADIDEVVLPVDSSQPCPLPSLLDQTSQQVRKLVENLQKFSAHETLEYAQIAPNGLPQSAHTAAFSYVADIREVRPGQLSVEEYRNDSLGAQTFPSRLATTGTAAFALIFHPYYLKDFNVSCEGLTQIDGRSAWQVHFVQRPDHSNNFRGYRVAAAYYPIQLKGRAWISQDTHEVLRLETDLVHPVPEIKLLREHVAIDYGPVGFPRHQTSLWLPRSATIHMDYRGHRYFHRHSFTGYQLFWVDTEQAVRPPAAADRAGAAVD